MCKRAAPDPLLNKTDGETPMSIKTKIATLAVAAIALTGSIAAANAGPKVNPVAAGLFGAAVIGTTIAVASQPHYVYPHRHRHCQWKPQYNVFGQFVGHVRVCHVHY